MPPKPRLLAAANHEPNENKPATRSSSKRHAGDEEYSLVSDRPLTRQRRAKLQQQQHEDQEEDANSKAIAVGDDNNISCKNEDSSKDSPRPARTASNTHPVTPSSAAASEEVSTDDETPPVTSSSLLDETPVAAPLVATVAAAPSVGGPAAAAVSTTTAADAAVSEKTKIKDQLAQFHEMLVNRRARSKVVDRAAEDAICKKLQGKIDELDERLFDLITLS